MRLAFYLPFFCFLFVTLLIFSSCKKDDNGPTISNEFTIGGDTRTLAKGFIKPTGENGNGSFEYEISLTSSEIFSNTQGLFRGMGDLVYLELNTSSSTGLVEGRYTFSSNSDVFIMDTGIVGIDYNIDTNSGGEFIYISGGTADIELVGDETIIRFDLMLPDGRLVNGSFRGELSPI